MEINTAQLSITLGRNRQEQNKTKQNKTKQNKVAVAAQENNYNIANYRTKIPGHISREFQTFRYLFHVSLGGPLTIFRENLLYISTLEGHYYITNSLNMHSWKLGNFWEKTRV
jgi:hypothetical protein